LLTILYPFCYILFACLAWWCFKRFKQKGVLNLLMEHSEYFSFEIDYEFISLFFIFSSILRNYVSDFSDLRENKTNFSTSKRILHILGRACGFGWYNQTITELGQLLFLNMKANFIHFESHFIIFSLVLFFLEGRIGLKIIDQNMFQFLLSYQLNIIVKWGLFCVSCNNNYSLSSKTI